MTRKERCQYLLERGWVSNGEVGDKERWKHETFVFLTVRGKWLEPGEAVEAERNLNAWFRTCLSTFS